jgi:hypothetical protein
MAPNEKQSSDMILSKPNPIEITSTRQVTHIEDPTPKVDTPTNLVSPPIRISYKAPGLEGKGRTTVSTSHEISPERSIVANSAVAASDFIHDILDDYGYPQSVSMSQMSMTPDEEQFVADRLGLNIDGSISKRVSTGEPLSPITSVEYTPNQDEITHSKTVDYFDDLTRMGSPSHAQTLEGKDSDKSTRKEALTFCKQHLDYAHSSMKS